MKKILFIFILLVSFKSAADSPLTSTDFGKAYLDIPIVQEAFKSKGKITTEMLEFIVEENNPLDVKLAIINSLGWDNKGIMNSKIFFMHVMKKKNYQSEFGNDYAAFKWHATSDVLICYSYMLSLDNYFDVSEAFDIASEALRMAPDSFAINMIYNLIKSQGLFLFHESCYATKMFLAFKDNRNLKIDMRKESMGYIFSYMISINDNCKKN